MESQGQLTKVLWAEPGLKGSCPRTGLCTQWVQW